MTCYGLRIKIAFSPSCFLLLALLMYWNLFMCYAQLLAACFWQQRSHVRCRFKLRGSCGALLSGFI